MIEPAMRTPPADKDKVVTDQYIAAVNLNRRIITAAQPSENEEEAAGKPVFEAADAPQVTAAAITFDACAQAEYAMIWRDMFLMQSGFGMLLALVGLFVGGAFSEHDERPPEPKEKRRP